MPGGSMDIQGGCQLLQELNPVQSFGKVSKVVGLIVEGKGLRAPLGSICQLIVDQGSQEYIPAEVVGFKDDSVLFMPYGELRGIKPGSLIKNSETPPLFPVGKRFLGRAVDSFGRPLDEKGKISPQRYYPLYGQPINPLQRPLVDTPLDVGVKAINSLLTLGKGQRMGIMAGSGVGKSTLMGMIARYTQADVNVIGLVGERGREVREFMEAALGEEGMSRSVLVVETSDKSALVRMRAAYACTAIAEYFRDQGLDVILMMDSVTRFAMASREAGLAAGEPPTTRGYTPSVFAQLPRLLERAGKSKQGSITGIYTVLVEGDDFNEPVADAVRSILDGHIVLDRKLADQGHYPSINVLQSISRLRSELVSPEVLQAGNRLTNLLSTYNKVEDMINIGAYTPGSSKEIDEALQKIGPIRNFLQQNVQEKAPLKDCFSGLQQLLSNQGQKG
ncbi:MAG: FliI/YscN family ATPase [Desulfohalobiaceae bacterium]